jgi:hypothetical protein
MSPGARFAEPSSVFAVPTLRTAADAGRETSGDAALNSRDRRKQ